VKLNAFSSLARSRSNWCYCCNSNRYFLAVSPGCHLKLKQRHSPLLHLLWSLVNVSC
jgi:hypothetical protein